MRFVHSLTLFDARHGDWVLFRVDGHLNDVVLRPTQAELQAARFRTDYLFSTVRDEHLYDRPIDRRHRLIFYLGHLEAFDWNHIARYGLDEPAFEPSLDQLFAAGIDPDSSHLPQDQPSDWPRLEQVRAYVHAVRARLDQLFHRAPAEILHMALEHRLMHAETLAYGLHAMPYGSKRGVDCEPLVASAPRGENSTIEIPAGQARLGRNDGFGWDNEFREHTVHVDAFGVQRYKVTNADYLEFVSEGAARPFYWNRGMFAPRAVMPDEPVLVTWNEASAYAKWKGMRLPTEAEWHRAAGDAEYPWGDVLPDRTRGNFDFVRWDTTPVTAHPAGASPYGIEQLAGNGWEWTATPFAPFDGFTPAPNYVGYSANFFDGEHYVLKGGSQQTAAKLLRRSFRNWFRSDYPYVYASFRCIAR